MAGTLEKRIDTLEKVRGLGKFAKIAEKIIYGTKITDAGLLIALGQTWERRPGESDKTLRGRALQELLKNNKRSLTQKVCLHYANLMQKTVNGGKAGS